MFCQDCGEELPKDANFCPKCGVMTTKGVDAGVSTPQEELKDAFSKMGEKIEKAYEKMEKSFFLFFTGQGPVICPHCGGKNVAGVRFCYQCGKKLD